MKKNNNKNITIRVIAIIMLCSSMINAIEAEVFSPGTLENLRMQYAFEKIQSNSSKIREIVATIDEIVHEKVNEADIGYTQIKALKIMALLDLDDEEKVVEEIKLYWVNDRASKEQKKYRIEWSERYRNYLAAESYKNEILKRKYIKYEDTTYESMRTENESEIIKIVKSKLSREGVYENKVKILKDAQGKIEDKKSEEIDYMFVCEAFVKCSVKDVVEYELEYYQKNGDTGEHVIDVLKIVKQVIEKMNIKENEKYIVQLRENIVKQYSTVSDKYDVNKKEQLKKMINIIKAKI